MIRAFYASGAAMAAQQSAVDAISNNVANVNTTGYKSLSTEFEQLLMVQIKRPDMTVQGQAGSQGVTDTLAFGCGVRASGTDRVWDLGVSAPTGRNMDFLLENEGFFAVRGMDGQVRYTRAGQFHASLTDTGFALVNSKGEWVLDQDGDPIELAGKPEDMEVGPTGMIQMGGAVTGITLGRFRFETPQGLLSEENAFSQTDASGPALDAAECRVRQGALEMSNVDMAGEMSRLINGQRLYQMNGKMLSWADEIEGMSIQLRG